jgi:ubiquinone/menaquinone biosynthesis C-methylase UbiE
MHDLLDKFFHQLRFNKVIKYIPANSIVCDIGSGKDASFLRQNLGLIEKGFGFDKNGENYKDSKIELKRVEIVKTIPLEDKSCDIVTLMAVLEHLEYPQEVLNDIFRILKRGGRFILTTPTPKAKSILEFLAFRIGVINREQIRDHKNYFSPKDIKKMLLEAGFEEEKIQISLFEFNLNQLAIAQK